MLCPGLRIFISGYLSRGFRHLAFIGGRTMDDHIPDHPNGVRRLRVAMLVPPWYELPPAGYGGLEQVCAALSDALVAQGHDVTVIGAGRRSGTSARFVSTMPSTQFPRLGEGMPEMLHITRANRLIDESDFDVVHDHTSAGLLTAATRPAPTVATVHNCPGGEIGDFLAGLNGPVALVAISSAQRRLRPELSWAATVHNGLAWRGPRAPAAGHVSTAERPVLWLARFSPDKGPDLAIQACRAAGLPLVLAGKCTERGEQRYLREVIIPMLGPDTELVLNSDRRRSLALLRSARCLIMPIRWQEPFGMVMVEAMAEGTPVVALDRGAVREVVHSGVTGLICADPGELPDALHQVSSMDPEACVAHVRQNFSAERMARRYTRVYHSVMLTGVPRVHPPAALSGAGAPR
jgi:glycosyltransferase involved in cell wall biosynthesis